MAHSIRLALLFVVALFAAPIALAQDALVPPSAPSKELIIRLLTQRDERVALDYSVAIVLVGEVEFQGLTEKNAARVTYFGPVIEDGNKRRELSRETFLWNAEYGWFLCEVGERLGRTTVLIWSELEGEVEMD